jgi:membrane-associated phospholipid phosphatase
MSSPRGHEWSEASAARAIRDMEDTKLEVKDGPRKTLATELLGGTALVSLALAVAALLLFTWIAEQVQTDRMANFDLAIRGWVHHFASPRLTRAMVALSLVGGNVLAAAFMISLLLFLSLRWRRAAAWLAITMAGALVLDLALKYGFHRARPTPFFGPMPHTYSFPSGHALFSFCFYGVLAGLLTARIRSLIWRILIWMVAAAVILGIGLSRIYLGVHYPSDVIAGYLAAALWVSTMLTLDRAQKNRQSAIRNQHSVL